jgi:hypothetical protein
VAADGAGGADDAGEDADADGAGGVDAGEVAAATDDAGRAVAAAGRVVAVLLPPDVHAVVARISPSAAEAANFPEKCRILLRLRDSGNGCPDAPIVAIYHAVHEHHRVRLRINIQRIRQTGLP